MVDRKIKLYTNSKDCAYNIGEFMTNLPDSLSSCLRKDFNRREKEWRAITI